MAHDAAGNLQLRELVVEGLGGDHEQHWIDPVNRDHLARLAVLPPRLAVEPPVLAGRAIHPDAIAAMQHLAIAADIDAARVRRARECDVARSHVTSAVARPELRCGQRGQVDIDAAQDDLVHRASSLGTMTGGSRRFIRSRDAAIMSGTDNDGSSPTANAYRPCSHPACW